MSRLKEARDRLGRLADWMRWQGAPWQGAPWDEWQRAHCRAEADAVLRALDEELVEREPYRDALPATLEAIARAGAEVALAAVECGCVELPVERLDVGSGPNPDPHQVLRRVRDQLDDLCTSTDDATLRRHIGMASGWLSQALAADLADGR